MISINHWGTTDIANYGDLLFPLILEKELQKRLGSVELRLLAPHGGAFRPDPLRTIDRITRFEEPGFYAQAGSCDAVVLGGGDIVRFDEGLATFYGAAAAAQSNRFNRLFLYDLGKLARVFPVCWNAVGIPYDFEPDQREDVRRATECVRYLSVRDELSKRRLEQTGIEREVHLVPDTAFLLKQLFSESELEKIIKRLKADGYFPGTGKILTFQMPHTALPLEPLTRALQHILHANRDLHLVLLPISACHRDLETLQTIHREIGQRGFIVNKETDIAEVASVIAHSTYFAGPSLHGNITAGVYGVDSLILNFPECFASKRVEYARFLGMDGALVQSVMDLPASLAKLVGNESGSRAAWRDSILRSLENHFDRLASEIVACQNRPAVVCMDQLRQSHEELVELMSEKLASKTRDLEQIRNSRGWQWLNRYGRVKHEYLLPMGQWLTSPWRGQNHD
jgi:polysaccharide pyruvyl transferase WcaK-like protein